LYRNEDGSVMYEMIDECLSCDILVNIKYLYFIAYPFFWYVVCFVFKSTMIECYI